jgi:hypothetical protein
MNKIWPVYEFVFRGDDVDNVGLLSSVQQFQSQAMQAG